MDRKTAFFMLITLLLVALTGCVPADSTTPAPAETSPTVAALEPLELAMGYIPSVQFTPFYVALQKGYYRDEGLDVQFRYGFESDLVKLVGTNELQFLIGSGDQVILGRSQGLPVVYVMEWYRRFPVVVFAPKSAGIDSPSDLEGRSVGIPGLFGASYVGWKALVEAAGIEETRVNLQSVGFTQAAAVKDGVVDAAVDYSVNGPVQLRLAGDEVSEFFVADYMDLPSNGIISNDKTVGEKPELVGKFVRATLRGLQDTLDNPDDAFAIALQQVPEAGADDTARQTNRAIFDASVALWRTDGTLGQSDPARWAEAATFMEGAGLIPAGVDPTTLYTNQFIPQ
jgi:NitT/TauT family transport system substrate-binding protein